MFTPQLMFTAQLIHEVVSQLPLAPGDGDDILGLADEKIAQIKNTIRGGSVLLGMIFVGYHAYVSKLAMARMFIAGLAAGVFIWIVFNITDIQGRVGNEIDSAPAVTAAKPTTAPTPPQAPLT
jgi:hypothetical protein